eukprot:m.32213 g.32213  ORF g.32213 m.32213 type:complete len:308 (-) comp4871_c0_seq1:20-943(-)
MTLYRDDPDWADITPVPQDDGPNPACPIAYAPEYVDCMDYFRAVYRAEEVSERALKLTEDVIDLNAANYTAWQYRRKLLRALKYNLQEEMEYITTMIEENIKNYQVWYHRRCVVEMLGDGSNELAFTEAILEQDAKNYHCWQHRHWAMERFNLFKSKQECGLDFVDRLLVEDVRNNSAWNHRYFVIQNTTGFTPDVVADEVAYALETVGKVAENESAWNYIKGISSHVDRGLLAFPHIKEVALLSVPHARCHVHALATLLDICVLEANDKNGAAASQAGDLCDTLIQKDEVRASYWRWRKTQLPTTS